MPLIAEQAEHLYVFQRSANYSVPAGNTPLDDTRRAEIKANYAERRALSKRSGGGSPFVADPRSALEVAEDERTAAYEERWRLGGVLFGKTFADQTSNLEANDTARTFAETKIRSVVEDQSIADVLIPNDHPIGTKRIVTDTNYYQTYNRDNVSLVDLKKAPIESIDAAGIKTTESHYDLDALVFATGFDAMTGALDRIDIRGRGGETFAGELASRAENLSGTGDQRLPEPVCRDRTGQPECSDQHDPRGRTARRLDCGRDCASRRE